MRMLAFAGLLLVGGSLGLSQTSAPAAPELPKDPRALLEMAQPMYDFSSGELKPWHLKATYQVYDEKGESPEQGTYEYWWASPQAYRSTWTRGNSTHSDWHTADGKHGSVATGERLKYFEYKLQSALVFPMPTEADLDPAKSKLERQAVSMGSAKVPCVMVSPPMNFGGKVTTVPLGIFPTYCFDPHQPVLLASYSLGGVTTAYTKVSKVQNRYLAREVTFYSGKQKLLTASVDTITGLSATDPALIPPANVPVSDLKQVNVAGGIAQGMLLKKEVPVYPQDAKDQRVSGTVVLQAVIGTDGSIHDLKVVSAPWPSLAASALWSVSRWQYRPYLLNGFPVEVETTVNVVYSLGG